MRRRTGPARPRHRGRTADHRPGPAPLQPRPTTPPHPARPRLHLPGCTAPAAWARAHHVRHWVDGGATDVANAALLCQRHHTTVHRRRLWATVSATPDQHGRYVVWDLTDGSYDRALAALPPPVPPTRPLAPPHAA
ncbi:HNH endonuclease [Phycicoccus sp. HDW14]|uniref:HNH endonuclease n=1 Tax=Phycicoccus sp. HDW14 TaxID=2714941 RepID=UPI0035302E0D